MACGILLNIKVLSGAQSLIGYRKIHPLNTVSLGAGGYLNDRGRGGRGGFLLGGQAKKEKERNAEQYRQPCFSDELFARLIHGLWKLLVF